MILPMVGLALHLCIARLSWKPHFSYAEDLDRFWTENDTTRQLVKKRVVKIPALRQTKDVPSIAPQISNCWNAVQDQ